MLRYLLLFLNNAIINSVCHLEIVGEEKIPKDGGCIFAANHLGRLDAFLVYYVIKRDDIILTVAEKYKKYAVFRAAAKAMDATWIDRFSSDFGALRQVYRRLCSGGVLAIAPEGTRSKTGSLIQGKPGAAYLGSKTQLPIYPVALSGTEDNLIKKNLRGFKKSYIKVIIGDPIILPNLPRKNRSKFLERYTAELMCQIAAQLPPEFQGYYQEHPLLFELLDSKKSYQPVSKNIVS